MGVPALRIAVVGGSIAGCAAAIELARAGHHVEVFERSATSLRGQGAAIALATDTLDLLLRRDLVDASLPRLEMREQAVLVQSAAHEPLGYEALRSPSDAWAINWADLHANLCKRLSPSGYHRGVAVQGAEPDHASVQLRFSEGFRRAFDLVAFADGHASMGRALVCPEAAPGYRGYVLWRGVLDGAELHDAAPLAHTVHRILYQGAAGHAVAYRMPPGDASPSSRAREVGLVNFGCYQIVEPDLLSALLVDSGGRQRRASVPAGELPKHVARTFQELARRRLPRYFADLMGKGRDTFLQPIFGARAPRQHVGRVCLLGDAATLLPPITGSGVMKAVLSAVGLARALRSAADLESALSSWDAQQTALGDILSELSERMERALIWEVPDLESWEPDAVRMWWQGATRVPRSASQPVVRADS